MNLGNPAFLDLPEGVYRASFQNEKGIFYEAPTQVIWTVSALRNDVTTGGLFLPHNHQGFGVICCWAKLDGSVAGMTPSKNGEEFANLIEEVRSN